MTDTVSVATLNAVLRRSGVSFFARRVMQRWQRGELSTDAAQELLQPNDVARLVGAWINTRGP
jgi:hypothetical protein